MQAEGMNDESQASDYKQSASWEATQVLNFFLYTVVFVCFF